MAFNKAGPDMENLLTNSQFLYEEQQISLNLWSVDMLSMSDEQVSQPEVGSLLWFGKLLCIYKN